MMTSYIVGLKSRYYEHADGHQYTRQDILAAIDKAAAMKDAAHAADLALLRDPAFVLTSMLCGSVAKISARQWLDAGGDATEMRDAICDSPTLSGLREACEALDAAVSPIFVSDGPGQYSILKSAEFETIRTRLAELRIALSAAEEPAKVTRGTLHSIRETPSATSTRRRAGSERDREGRI